MFDLELRTALAREHRSHLVARLQAATTVDTKLSKLLGNKGLCGKLAFCQLNYSRSAGTSNYSKEVLCAPSQNWPAWESKILPPEVPLFIPKDEVQRIRAVLLAKKNTTARS